MAAVAVAASLTLATPPGAFANGESACLPSDNSFAGQELTVDGAWDRGARATIEGQALPLCIFAGNFYPSGAFHWAALEYLHWWNGNIVQVGYGRCLNTNNGIGLGTVCNGNYYYYYYYWAWGSWCGVPGTEDGSGGPLGPVAIRIGPALSVPPSTKDFYVLRRIVNGVARYEGFVGGQLLTGTDALGNTVSASVPASELCWDGLDVGTLRREIWFGETFNTGDSMGGWIGTTRNHLDYTSVRYSVNTGWLSPNWSFPHTCGLTTPGIYGCTRSGSDRLYIDSR